MHRLSAYATCTMLTFCIVFSSQLFAGEKVKSWEKTLAKDWVLMTKEKMTISVFEICTGIGSDIQIKLHSEAPSDGSISRDLFVAITAVTLSEVEKQLSGKNGCKAIDPRVEQPDVELTINMTKQSITTKTYNRRTNTRRTNIEFWSVLYAE